MYFACRDYVLVFSELCPHFRVECHTNEAVVSLQLLINMTHHTPHHPRQGDAAEAWVPAVGTITGPVSAGITLLR